ncbi:Plectin/S10 domain-containing protein [Melampsora americana]|nr:Plectin/S10 domain-containing protein [Melampsora americana]
MIISKEDRRTIYENLFKDGVMVAQKDYNAPKHVELEVPNLHVIKACQSLNSRGFIKTQFSWNYYYYTLTDEGIEYLREWLNLPSEIVPATFKKVQRATPAGRPQQSTGAYRPPRGEGGDREGYRKKDGGNAEGGFRPKFAGIGRGSPSGGDAAPGGW